jgi:hypothetical protein
MRHPASVLAERAISPSPPPDAPRRVPSRAECAHSMRAMGAGRLTPPGVKVKKLGLNCTGLTYAQCDISLNPVAAMVFGPVAETTREVQDVQKGHQRGRSEAHAATNKEQHVCARRRVGEPAVSSRPKRTSTPPALSLPMHTPCPRAVR